MAKHRTHSIECKRQVAQEFLAGETLHGLAKRHDICRNLIRVWVQKYEAHAATPEHVEACRRRKKVEMLFAPVKRILRLTRLRLRGPNGAKDEFLLAATAQNLRRLARLRPMNVLPQAMAAQPSIGRLESRQEMLPTPSPKRRSLPITRILADFFNDISK
jgi:transposase-like protein